MTADLIASLDTAATRLAAMLGTTQGARTLPAPDWLARAEREGSLRRPVVWRNTVVRTKLLRRAHVEFFAIPGEIAVLHLCAFPRLDRALPILGFDVIAGREKATGCFLDLSPTVTAATPIIADWAAATRDAAANVGEPRVLPDWAAAIFSPAAVAVRPRTPEDVEAGLALGATALSRLLAMRSAPTTDWPTMRDAQLRYIEAQHQNDRTRRMLAGCVGPALADAFIARMLFPPPPQPRPPRPRLHAVDQRIGSA